MDNDSSLDLYLGGPIMDKRVNASTFEKTIMSTTNQYTKWKANSIS